MFHSSIGRFKLAFSALLVLSLLPAIASALYVKPEIQEVPIDRLVANLTKQAKLADVKDEKQAQKAAKLYLNLARAHAMAYALRTDTTKVLRGQLDKGPWFGFEPKHIPFGVKKTDDMEQDAKAKKHLEQAITAYAQSLKVNGKDFTARLGQAWCFDQAGKKADAKKLYRGIIDDAWQVEMNMRVAPLGWHSVVAETSFYLKQMLDKERDAAELEELDQRIAKVANVPRPVTPIAVPLEDDVPLGRIIDETASVRFDADGSGLAKSWTWIAPQAAWLVRDPQGSGKISSALQMFGSVTYWMFWDNGYDALSALDDNADGQLAGDELQGLALWHDANSNGASEPGEVRPLAEWGIVAISCRYEFTPGRNGIPFSAQGVTYRDGNSRPTYDVVLREKR